jgi:sugar phosphate isomerase/epimerase
LAKKAGFDGIDLALWKNFDAWNVNYVKKLVETHDLPVRVIQTSSKLNKKEMEKALDLCEALNVDTISVNAPKFFDYRSFNFIKDNIGVYKKANKDIKFSIINPLDSSFFAIPIPKYHFSNLVEIIKKYGCNLGLDVAGLDEDSFEDDFMRKLGDFVPYISTVYLSDKTKEGKMHVLPGDGTLKLPTLLKKLKKNKYARYFSLKIGISK